MGNLCSRNYTDDFFFADHMTYAFSARDSNNYRFTSLKPIPFNKVSYHTYNGKCDDGVKEPLNQYERDKNYILGLLDVS